MKEFVDALENDSEAVKRLKLMIISADVQDELFNISTYKAVPDAIVKLEEQGMEKEEQWRIYSDIFESLDGFAKEKITASLAKNPDVVQFATNRDLQLRIETKFAPLVSVDVECSFSLYKSIFSDKRENLTFDSIEMYNVVCFNHFLFE